MGICGLGKEIVMRVSGFSCARGSPETMGKKSVSVGGGVLAISAKKRCKVLKPAFSWNWF